MHRLNPRLNFTLEQIAAELPCAIEDISQASFHEKIFYLPASINISSCSAYKSGKVILYSAGIFLLILMCLFCRFYAWMPVLLWL